MLQIKIQKTLQGSEGSMVLDVDLEIEKGSFVLLMGASGSGKTTLLRILAGLESSEGVIILESNSWKNVPAKQRGIGFVFQDYALFEHMSVEENLLFVKKDKNLARELLDMTELSSLASRNVKSLSGGQKQRVALCRAMMQKPNLLLMDEPLSALDEKMSEKLQKEIMKLHKVFGTTTLMVSHDAQIAYALADRVIVLKQGSVIKDGTKDEVLLQEKRMTYRLMD